MLGKAFSLANWKQLSRDSLFRNSFYITLTNIVGGFLGFVFWIVAARYYSPADVGLASAAIAALGLLSSLSNLGLQTGIMRFLPRSEDRRGMMNASLTISGLSSLVLGAVFLAGLPVWSSGLVFVGQSAALIAVFLACAVTMTLTTIQRFAFSALRVSQFALAQQTVCQLSKVILLVAFVSLGSGGILFSWAGSLVLATVAATFFMVVLDPAYRPVPAVRNDAVKRMMGFSFANYFADGLNTAPVFVLPLVVLGALGAQETAFFYVSNGVAQVLYMVPASIMLALFAEGANDKRLLRNAGLRAVKLVAAVVFPALLVLFLAADRILLLFGEEYSRNAVRLLQMLGLSALFFAVNEAYATVNRIRSRVKPVILLYVSTSVVTLASSVFLVRVFGLDGVGYGWLLGQAVTALGVLAIMFRGGLFQYLRPAQQPPVDG